MYVTAIANDATHRLFQAITGCVCCCHDHVTVDPAGAANVTDPQFNTCFEDVYTAPSLQVPWNLVLGNVRGVAVT